MPIANSVNLPYSPDLGVAAPREQEVGESITYKTLERGLKLIGIDIDPEDIHSVHMEPSAITVDYYAEKHTGRLKTRIYPMTFMASEQDQEVLWEAAV